MNKIKSVTTMKINLITKNNTTPMKNHIIPKNIVTKNNNNCQEDFSNLLKNPERTFITENFSRKSDKYFAERVVKEIKYALKFVYIEIDELQKFIDCAKGRKRNTTLIRDLILNKFHSIPKSNKYARRQIFKIVRRFKNLVKYFIKFTNDNKEDGIKLYCSILSRIEIIRKKKTFTVRYKHYCDRTYKNRVKRYYGEMDSIYAKTRLSKLITDKHIRDIAKNVENIKDQATEEIQYIDNKEFKTPQDYEKKQALILIKNDERLQNPCGDIYYIKYLLSPYYVRCDYRVPKLEIRSPKIGISRIKYGKCASIIFLEPDTPNKPEFKTDGTKALYNMGKHLSKNYDAVVEFNKNNTIESAFRLVGISQERKKDFISCPFHNDKNPSMHFMDNEKRAKCHSCGKYIKSPFDAIEQITNNKEEALRLIKGNLYIEEKRIPKPVQEKNKENDILSKDNLKTNAEAQDRYIKHLSCDAMAQNYLYEIRNISTDVAEKFKLGSSRTRENILCVKIPHITLEGDVIGIITNIPEGKPKYINSSYEKSYRPFGEFQTKGEHESIIFTEGVYDCINAHDHGATNCVSNLGAATTPEKIIQYVKSRKAKKLVLAFDNDEAGDRSTLSVIEYAHMNTLDIEISILDLKEAKDLDDYLKENETMPKEISMMAYIFKKTYNSIESKKYLTEYGMKIYNGKNLLFKMFPFLAKINKLSIQDIIKNFSNYLKSVENEKKSEELKKRSIIWRESSYQDREYKSDIEDSTILDFEILRRQDEEIKRDILINKYIKIRTCSLNLIIGDTGVGKTTFATHLASLNSEKQYNQLYISLEMDCGELFRKCFVFNEVYGRIPKKNLTIIEERFDLDHIIETIREHKEKDPDLKIVYIDHLHLINIVTELKNLIPMDKIANDLLELCRELRIAIIGICQLTRESTKMYSAPQLHDIKNSSNLENNASVILGIHNPYLNTLRAARAICFEELSIDKRNKIRGKENCYILSVLKNRHDRIIEATEYLKVEVINEEKNIVEQMAFFILDQ